MVKKEERSHIKVKFTDSSDFFKHIHSLVYAADGLTTDIIMGHYGSGRKYLAMVEVLYSNVRPFFPAPVKKGDTNYDNLLNIYRNIIYSGDSKIYKKTCLDLKDLYFRIKNSMAQAGLFVPYDRDITERDLKEAFGLKVKKE